MMVLPHSTHEMLLGGRGATTTTTSLSAQVMVVPAPTLRQFRRCMSTDSEWGRRKVDLASLEYWNAHYEDLPSAGHAGMCASGSQYT